MKQAELVAECLERVGYRGELSAVAAAIPDISESVEEITERIAPSLIDLGSGERNKALDNVIDLIFALEHIRDHASSAIEELVRVRDFLDVSPRSGATPGARQDGR